ncbi:hypothetical protein [Cyanobium sp. Cruz-8D1]|uniref:hypothetical protein n=1 Tax=Cyanobium sp. Cruz-8D1 TaxID=2823711 RepID=UPI0020CD3532|nr:hypothetical protein [Cyanobium sp. Cruz-8D1]
MIPTPAMDRVAKAGLQYICMFSTALCSPTRPSITTPRRAATACASAVIPSTCPCCRPPPRSWPFTPPRPGPSGCTTANWMAKRTGRQFWEGPEPSRWP